MGKRHLTSRSKKLETEACTWVSKPIQSPERPRKWGCCKCLRGIGVAKSRKTCGKSTWKLGILPWPPCKMSTLPSPWKRLRGQLSGEFGSKRFWTQGGQTQMRMATLKLRGLIKNKGNKGKSIYWTVKVYATFSLSASGKFSVRSIPLLQAHNGRISLWETDHP